MKKYNIKLSKSQVHFLVGVLVTKSREHQRTGSLPFKGVITMCRRLIRVLADAVTGDMA